MFLSKALNVSDEILSFLELWPQLRMSLVPGKRTKSRQGNDCYCGDQPGCLGHGLTPELSRTALRPWASETQWYLHEAAKRARLERIVRAHLHRSTGVHVTSEGRFQ